MARILANFLLALGLCGFSASAPSTAVTISPGNVEVVKYPNDSYIVTCHADGVQVKWVSPEGKQVTDVTGRLHVEPSHSQGEGALALFFETIRSADKGKWTCQTVGGDEQSNFFTMIINEPISFHNIKNTVNAQEGSNVTVNCIAKGDPPPSISWSFNGVLINGSTYKYKKTAQGLLIRNVSLTDKGQYTCKAAQVTTAMSNLMEKVIELNVEHKPIPVVKLPLHAKAEMAYGLMHGVVNLTCAAVAEPAASFFWLFNGKMIPKSTGRIYEDTHISALNVEIRSEDDLGDYICEAKNTVGDMRRVITLFEGYAPEMPTEISLVQAGSETLDIRVEVNEKQEGSLNIIGIRFQFMRAPDRLEQMVNTSLNAISNYVTEYIASSSTELPETLNEELWKDSHRMDFELHPNSTYNLSGLESNTTYAIRAMSRNLAGHSHPTTAHYYRTLKLEPGSIIGGAGSARASLMMVLGFMVAMVVS